MQEISCDCLKLATVCEGKECQGLGNNDSMAPAQCKWDVDNLSLIADEDMMEDKRDEGNGKGVVGMIANKVKRVENGDDNEVKGSTDAYTVKLT